MAQLSGKDGIVIVGGGLAGQRCAEALRRHGYDGQLRIVCAESRRPYDRPPLSKEMLAGRCDEDSLAFRAADWYEARGIDLLLGVGATGLDLAQRRVVLADGSRLSYRQVVIATGSRPRNLPLLDGFENVSSLRSVEDCHELRQVIAQRPRLAVVGAGFIGQEVAATARRLGAQVTMIEAASAPLAAILGPKLGSWFSRLHESEGVRVLTDSTVTNVVANGAVRALRLASGATVETDHVVVGVGVEADVGWLAGSPIAARGGVRADSSGRTPVAGVYAIGDAAATYDPVVGSHLPGSHWEAAGRQAVRSARAMLGLDPGPLTTSSFWTDQYGLRIQYLGHARLADAVQIDGDPGVRSFTVTFTRAGRPIAALLVNRARDLPRLRNLIEQGAT